MVLLKVHRHALNNIKQDLLWALEALAREVLSSGYDFRILYEVIHLWHLLIPDQGLLGPVPSHNSAQA